MKIEIAEALLKKFEERFSCIEAELPEISVSSPLPYNFYNYKFIKVSINKTFLRKKDGSFKAIFKIDNSERSIYFKYKINAKIDVFKAKHKLYNDKILTTNDYEKIQIKLDKLPNRIITCSIENNLMSKSYIRANSLLTMNKFVYKQDVLRGDNLRAYVQDGILVIGTEATVLKNGNIGDIIKIRTDKGKVFNAKLISKYKAIILE